MNYSIFSKNKNKAFTLVELVVVMAIAMVITTAVVIQQNNWNEQLTVRTQAYELAIMIRQAQIYSLGVREDIGGSGDKFNVGYGIHFDSSNLGQYIYFADRNGNKTYGSGEAVETKTFNRGVTIEKICGVNGGTETCSPSLSQIDITFFRPDPKANINFNSIGFGSPATIYLQSSSGNNKYKITINAGGQISIQ